MQERKRAHRWLVQRPFVCRSSRYAPSSSSVGSGRWKFGKANRITPERDRVGSGVQEVFPFRGVSVCRTAAEHALRLAGIVTMLLPRMVGPKQAEEIILLGLDNSGTLSVCTR